MAASPATLPRRLGLRSAVFVLVGSTIGSGIFRTPSVVAGRVADPAAFLLVWAAGGLVAMAGALCLAEVAASLPHTGGIYAYLRRAYGERAAFAFGWAELVALRPAAYGAIALTASEYALRAAGVDDAAAFLPGISRAQTLAAVSLVAVGSVGRRGLDKAAGLQDVTTVLKLAALVALSGLTFLAPAGGAGSPANGGPAPLPGHAAAEGAVGLAGLGTALVAVFWSYDGWADVGFVGGEVKNPGRNLPRAFLLGTALVTGVYLGVNAGYLRWMSLEAVAASPLVAADAAAAAAGAGAERAVAAAVALSTFGCLNGSMMTGPRVFFAMAEDGLLPRGFARVHPRHGTPAGAIDLSVGLGVAFVLLRTFAQLADQFVLVIWPFYAAAVVAVLVLRRKEPDLPRPIRIPVASLWVALFFAAALLMTVGYVRTAPATVAANVLLVGAALPIHGWIAARRRRKDGGGPGADEAT